MLLRGLTMKRPSFQFYPGDWTSNSNLGRCSWAARGCWLDLMCVLHDQEEYGIWRFPLRELAKAARVPLKYANELVFKQVLKGGDEAFCDPFFFVPRSGRKDGPPVLLVPACEGPVWFSSRMVTDEYKRQNSGASTRFGAEKTGTEASPAPAPRRRHGDGQGDGSSSSSSSSLNTNTNTSRAGALVVPGKPATAAEPELDLDGEAPRLKLVPALPSCPHQAVLALWAELMPELQQSLKWTDARATLLRTRWREEAVEHHWTSEEDGLRFFSKLFRWCRKSSFLMGKTNPRAPGGTPFSLTLPWLLKAENWAKVQEGNFHSEG